MPTWFEKIENKAIYLGIIILCLYLAPFFIFGQNAHVLIHDNLDSLVVWYKVLIASGKIFSPDAETIDQLINGAPRLSMGSEFNIIIWLNYLFQPFTAYVINQILMHTVAYAGMYLVLKKHVLAGESEFVCAGTALCFALLPFWPSGALSVAGLPLVLYALLNIRRKNAGIVDWLILSTLPFFSSFVLSFSFFLSIMGCLWIYDFVKQKRLNWQFGCALLLMTTVFICVEYRLVFSMLLQEDFVSHRTEFLYGHKPLSVAVKTGGINFLYGQYHAASLHTFFVLAASLLALVVGSRQVKHWGLLLKLLLLAAAISLFYGLWSWTGLLPFKEQYTILRAFSFNRYHWLHPLIWHLAFGIALAIIYRVRFGKTLVLLLVAAQIVLTFYNSDELAERRKHNPSFREFYSEALFQDIARYIGKEQNSYRVVSVGLHPSVAQYNGFYTLDAYIANYPLAYKHQFRQMIEQELNKSNKLQEYYDNWGSRLYVFSSELEGKGFLIKKGQKAKISKLNFNTLVFREMGGQYVFSTVEILNAQEIGLILDNTFERADSPWRIYLYKVTK